MNRRSLLLGSLGLLAAPAIVRAESLMKIVVPKPRVLTLNEVMGIRYAELLATYAQSMDDLMCFGTSFTQFTANGPRRIDPREIVIKDWPYHITKAPPGGFKLA